MDRIRDYGYKARILRQIMSNKARRYRKINAAQNLSTVVLTSFLGFMGFSGTDRLQTYLNWFIVADKLPIEFAFNILIFGLFVLATLHLVFQFGSKQTTAESAIVGLTQLVNYVDDLMSKQEQGAVILGDRELESVRQRYDILTQIIPANSDAEFVDAKKDIHDKERRAAQLPVAPQALFDPVSQQQILKAVVLKSAQVMQILQVLRSVGHQYYLAGGLVRNLVWDYLHGFTHPTPVDDVDVVYYEPLSATKQHDINVEATLKLQIPNLDWSVKNQARMHIFNAEQPYGSLLDAINKWPETSTSIAVRLVESGEIEVLAPHGLTDLFRLLVRPTPHYAFRSQRILERIEQKRWRDTWPKLEIIVPTPP